MRWLGAVLAVCLVATAVTGAAASTAEQRIVERARLLLEDFGDDPNFRAMPVYVRNAYGVVVVPDMLEGGFVVGGSYGRGVMLVRDVQSGAWSPPIFVRVVGGSVGLQLGGQAVDLVTTLMSEAAVRKVLTSRFKVGAGAKGALGPVGAGIGAGTTLNFGEDAYFFARAKGLFASLAVEGTAILPDEEANRAYYGRPLTLSEIVGGTIDDPASAGLRQVLASF